MKTAEVLNVVKNNGREAKKIATFGIGNNMPLIDIKGWHGSKVNLNPFANILSRLGDDEAFVIGRNSQYSDYALPYASLCVSRIHCMITKKDDRYTLWDCSLNGTTVEF